jgi:DNA-binding ferritin-like protein (Dps family)
LQGALGNTEYELVQKKELLKQQEDRVKNLLQVLREILSSIHEFYIFDEDQVKVENQLQVNYISFNLFCPLLRLFAQELEREVKQQLDKSKSLNSEFKEHYTQTQEYLPSDLAHEVRMLCK